jgi:hypothetical protein
MGLAFLLIGAAGALWRMVVRTGLGEPADHEMALSTKA